MSEEVGNVDVSATETQTDTAESVSSTSTDEAPKATLGTGTETEKATANESEPQKETETDSKTQDAGKVEPQEDMLDKFSFSEDYGFNDEQKKQALDVMKSFGVQTKAQAQNVVDFLTKIDEQRAQAETKSKEEMLSRWDKALNDDLDFSKNYDANMVLAEKALKQYGGEDLTKWLVNTGFNRNPDIVKMFYRIGKDLEDAKVLTGSQSSGNKLQHDRFGNATFNLTKSFGDK